MLRVEGVSSEEFQANAEEFREEVFISLEEMAGMDEDTLRGHHLPLTITLDCVVDSTDICLRLLFPTHTAREAFSTIITSSHVPAIVYNLREHGFPSLVGFRGG